MQQVDCVAANAGKLIESSFFDLGTKGFTLADKDDADELDEDFEDADDDDDATAAEYDILPFELCFAFDFGLNDAAEGDSVLENVVCAADSFIVNFFMPSKTFINSVCVPTSDFCFGSNTSALFFTFCLCP